MEIDFVKQELQNRLPSIVWIGPQRTHCQPAVLSKKDPFIEYEMMNCDMQQIPPTTAGNTSIVYFQDYHTFESWISQLNEQHQRYIKLKELYQKIIDITKLVNENLKWSNEELLPNVHIDLPKQEIFTSNSIKRLLETTNDIIDQKLEPHSTRLLKWLNNNKLSFDIGKCKEELDQFDLDYFSVFKPVLQKHYQPRHDKLDDTFSVLKLGQRSGSTYIAAHRFLWEMKQLGSLESKKQAMRDRWNKFQ